MSTTTKPPQWAIDARTESEDCVRLADSILDRELHGAEREQLRSLFESCYMRGIARHAPHAELIKKAADMLDELRTAVLARMVQGDEPSPVRVKKLMDVYDRSGKALAELRAAGE